MTKMRYTHDRYHSLFFPQKFEHVFWEWRSYLNRVKHITLKNEKAYYVSRKNGLG